MIAQDPVVDDPAQANADPPTLETEPAEVAVKVEVIRSREAGVFLTRFPPLPAPF